MVDALRHHDDPTIHLRCLRMHGRGGLDRVHLHLDPRWQRGVREIGALEEAVSLDLGRQAGGDEARLTGVEEAMPDFSS